MVGAEVHPENPAHDFGLAACKGPVNDRWRTPVSLEMGVFPWLVVESKGLT